MSLTNLNTLINATAQNGSQFKGLSAAYGILLGGTPSIDGYTALINQNNTSNFGAGGTTVFNDENIYINTINALYQGNPTAKSTFDAIVASAATIQDALTLVYNFVIPASARTEAGLNFFKSQAAFYAGRAAELGVGGTNGTALVAFASLTKIAVDNDIGGLGDTINDLRAAVANGTAAIPQGGTVFTPLETADGTQFDPDDVAGGGANQGQTFTLTTGADNVVGTAGNDTINGLSAATAAAATDTLTVVDVIDGGAGTDTLNITVTATNTDVTDAAIIKNIEFIGIRNTAATTAGTASVSATGLEGVIATGTGDVTITNLASGKSFTANGATGAPVISQGYVATATAAVTNLTGATLGNLTLVGAALTSATINSSGAANTAAAVDVAGAKTITVDAATNLTVASIATTAASSTLSVKGAAASVNVGTLDTDVVTVDASGLTAGGLTATMSATATTVVTGGKGNDVITTGAVLTTGSVAAGDGTADRLIVTDNTHIATAALAGKYTGFEELQVQNGISQDASLIAGLTALRMNDGAAATTLTNVSAALAGAITVIAGDGAATIAVKDATNVGQIDTVKLTFNDGNTTLDQDINASASTFTLAGVENLEITAVDQAEITQSAATSGALASVKFFGAGTTSFTTGDMATSNFALDGSAATGKLTINATAFATNGVAITGGSNDDNLTGSAQADIITGGGGKDTINGLAGKDTINAGAGADTINVTTANQQDVITGGADADNFKFQAANFADTLKTSAGVAGVVRITDFTAGTDKIVLDDTGAAATSIVLATAQTIASAADLTAVYAGITAISASVAAGAYSAVVVTVSAGAAAGTYLYVNDATAGVSNTDDMLVNITGITGTLAASDFLLA